MYVLIPGRIFYWNTNFWV